jgi:AraC-like DNA-binding protein
LIIKIIKPSPALDGYVKYLWYLENNSDEYTEMIYPTGEMQMLFHFGIPFVNVTDEKFIYSQKRYIMHGQNIKPGKIKACTNSGMIGVVFYPYSASAFINIPLNEIAGMEIEIADIFKSWNKCNDEYLNTIDLNSRISIIEKFLLEHLKTGPYDRYNLAKMFISEINCSGAAGNLSDIYKKFEINEKKAERLIKTFIGISPKKYFDIARIQHAIKRIYSSGSLTAAAYESGYYDQSHFIHKFKEITGITPGEFLKICPTPENII